MEIPICDTKTRFAQLARELLGVDAVPADGGGDPPPGADEPDGAGHASPGDGPDPAAVAPEKP
ncbi:MAG: hypothetical protein KA419_01165 [Acidobacteria bacterium]|nr:hypothetical protein [Acidobacteriota bacterium]